MTFSEIMHSEGFVPNIEQLPVIRSTANTVVSAGAGAGKTAVLSWRFLRLVMEEGVKPEQILTLTFTKKAANEMRERIYARLMKAKDSLPEGTLESFTDSTIATLDSFCTAIVRSDCIRYGIPRDFSNLSDEDLDVMAHRLADRFVDDPDNADDTALIASLLMPSRMMGGFFSIIASKSSICGDYDTSRIVAEFIVSVRAEYARLREILGSLLDSLGNMNLSPTFQGQYTHIRECYEKQCFTESDYFRKNGLRDPEIKETVAEFEKIVGKDTGFNVLQDIALGGESCMRLQTAVEKYTRMLNYEKRRTGMLTFRDVSDLAVMILRDNLALRKVFRDKFRFIMIDEFQDNNSVQRDLLFLLSEREGAPSKAGIVPSVEDLVPDKLFFVGDEKQSIYAFRGADVSVFRSLQTDLGKNGCSLELNTNYRSQEKLIRHFNNVFSRILYDDGKPFSARYSPILHGRKDDGTTSKIIFSVYNILERSEDMPDAGTLEAEAVGDYCLRILNTDEFLVAGKRPRPEDIAIIFRTSSNQMNIEKALKKRSIDYQTVETRSLMLDAVANDFYVLFNHILYPDDCRTYAALLKSPFCGLSDDSVRSLIKGGEVQNQDRERYEAFSTFLSTMKENAFRLSISDLMEKAYVDGGYKAYLSSKRSRSTFAEHYEYLFSYACAFDSDGRGLCDYVRFLRGNLGKAEKLPETQVLHSGTHGVQIMTVHKSKGLEFKVVIFAGLGSRGKSDTDEHVFEYGGNLVASENKTILRMLQAERSERREAELRRVMYVALTRARDHLILIGGYKPSASGITAPDQFLWYKDAVGADFLSGKCDDEDVTLEDVTQTAQAPFAGDRSIPFPENVSFRPFNERQNRIPVTQLEARAAHEATAGEVLERTPADDLIEKYGLQDKFGTLCHSVLEHTMRDGSADDVKCDLCESSSDNEILLAQAKLYAASFVGSAFFRDFVQGRKTAQEVRFYTSGPTLPDTAVEGVMDLIVFGDDCNLVVDYKTDSVKNPQSHRVQVMTYIKAATEIYGKRCLGTLFYLREGKAGDFIDAGGSLVELPTPM